MVRYHCPYCSPRYQIHKKRSDGVFICGLCGDPLIKVPAIKPTQIFAFLAASAFIAPLIMSIFGLIQDLKRPELKETMQASALVFKGFNLRAILQKPSSCRAKCLKEANAKLNETSFV